MMWKRALALLTGAITIAVAGVVVASMTPAGAAALRGAGGAITGAISAARPLVETSAGGGGGSGQQLGPIVLSIKPRVHFVSKLTADVDVSVTCGPFVEEDFSNLNVEITQAAGHTVAHAYGTLGSPLPCDGNTYTFVVTVEAQNVPLRTGRAQADAYADASGVDAFGNFEYQQGSTSAAVALKK